MKRSIGFILVLYLLAGVLYATSAPIMEVSDEPRHVAMVEWLARGNPLPVQDPQQHGPYEQEGSQPPLYYWVTAGVAQLFDRSDYDALWVFNPHSGAIGQPAATTNRNQMLHPPGAENFPWQRTTLAIMVMRLLGVLMGGVAVFCTWRVGREVCGANDHLPTPHAPYPTLHILPILAAALTAFNPMFLHIMGSVNNDTLAVMWSSLALALGAGMIVRGITHRSAVLLGIVLGCAALTKASGLALVLVVPVFVLARPMLAAFAVRGSARTARGSAHAVRRYSIDVLLIVGPVVAIAGWWYVRNWVLYGEVTGTQMMALIAGARDTPALLAELTGEWGSFLWAYWGLFGALNIALPAWIYQVFQGLWIVAGLGLLLRGVVWLRQSPHTPILSERALLLGMLGAVLGVAFVALLRWTSITLASQGRLLFPIIVAISVLTAWGLDACLEIIAHTCQVCAASFSTAKTYQRTPDRCVLTAVLAGSISLALLVLAFVVPFVYIRPAYARPILLASENDLPPNLHKTELIFEDKLRWIGYTVDRTRMTWPEREINVTLYWQARQPITQNLSLGLRLYGRDAMSDTQLLVLDMFPGGGMWPTRYWQPGQIIADAYRLRVPDTPKLTEMAPTVVKLDVAFYRDLNGRDFITDTRTPSGEPAPRQFYPIAGLAAPPDRAINTTAPLAQWTHASLLTVQAQQEGRKVRLTTMWHCTQSISEDYTMFVQLFAPGDPLPKAQRDGPIDRLPLRWWRAGDVVIDSRVIDLPDALPPGNYTIKLGFYKPVEPYERMGMTQPPIPDMAYSVDVDIQ